MAAPAAPFVPRGLARPLTAEAAVAAVAPEAPVAPPRGLTNAAVAAPCELDRLLPRGLAMVVKACK